MEVESVRRREEDAAAPTAICRMAKMVPAPHEPAEPLLVVRAQPITGAATDSKAGPLSSRSAVTEATQTVLRAVAEPERADHRWADEEVTGYTLERTVRGQRLPTRLIKVLIYWPFRGRARARKRRGVLDHLSSMAVSGDCRILRKSDPGTVPCDRRHLRWSARPLLHRRPGIAIPSSRRRLARPASSMSTRRSLPPPCGA